MGLHSTRTTPEIDDYLNAIIREGYARNGSEAIKLILLERMLKDKGGKVSPFKYKVGPTPRNTKGKRREGREIGKAKIMLAESSETERAAKDPAAAELPKIGEEAAEDQEKKSLPLRDAAAYRGALSRTAAAEISPTSEEIGKESHKSAAYFGSSSKPVYPGTLEEYEKEPRKNEFLPPEA